jgi:hypothetical protein
MWSWLDLGGKRTRKERELWVCDRDVHLDEHRVRRNMDAASQRKKKKRTVTEQDRPKRSAATLWTYRFLFLREAGCRRVTMCERLQKHQKAAFYSL